MPVPFPCVSGVSAKRRDSYPGGAMTAHVSVPVRLERLVTAVSIGPIISQC